MDINSWVKEVHELAVAKGWHEKPREAGTIHMLMVSEIAEATEAARKNLPPLHWYTRTGVVSQQDISGGFRLFQGDELQKPDGEAVELADCVIRIMDYFGKKNWDLEAIIKSKHEYNKTRSHRHGNKAF